MKTHECLKYGLFPGYKINAHRGLMFCKGKYDDQITRNLQGSVFMCVWWWWWWWVCNGPTMIWADSVMGRDLKYCI